ncbi:MAG: 50S ribosomal protein L11 methyltransferase, partial [Actinomycetota bacterium]|nr:50S ribosomal protein L11 methyltransferase [Actinomycetota bacterium]
MHLLTLAVRPADVERALDVLMPAYPEGVHLHPGDGHTEILVYRAEPPAPVAGLDGLLVAPPNVAEVSDDWRVRRRERFRAPVFGGRLVVRPEWADPLPGTDLEVVLAEAGAAFGSGSHPTTRACLELLCRVPVEDSIADLGCGSGVLAVAAARLGWPEVHALDVDPRSVRATTANARRNGVEVAVRAADLTAETPAPTTVALANVPPFVHAALAPRLSSRTVVATGVESGDAGEVVGLYRAAG